MNAASDLSLMGRRIMVAGGTGFLGVPLCLSLLGAGARTFAVSRTPPRARTGVDWVRCDLSSSDATADIFRDVRPDVVIHLAGYGVGNPGLQHVMGSVQADLLPTINVLVAAAEHGCQRVVVMGSLEEPRSMPPVPGSPYAAAKCAGTSYARMFYRLYGLPVVIVRPFMTYGPGQPAHKLVPSVTLSLLRNEAPRVGSGKRLVDWVFVDDVVRGIAAAAQRPGIDGMDIDLGSGELVSVQTVVERIVALSGSGVQPAFGAIADRPFEPERRADGEAAAAHLGWTTEVPLDEGLRRTIEYYRSQLDAGALGDSVLLEDRA